jgi:hypothetical protein
MAHFRDGVLRILKNAAELVIKSAAALSDTGAHCQAWA